MLPGGKHESDETPLQTSIRETFEETGIKAINPRLRVFATHNHGYRDRVYLVYIFEASEFSGKLVESEEGKPAWLEKDKLLKSSKLYPDLKRHIDMILSSPENEVIFTYHKFNNKLEIIETG